MVVDGINTRSIAYLRSGVVCKHKDPIIPGTSLTGMGKHGACPRYGRCGGWEPRRRLGGTRPANGDASM